MPGVSNAVFLSYASEDAEAAERVATALRAAGVEVWFDKSELRGGDAWDRQIREQIHDCRLFIPVISTNSERRDEGYFRREWSLAADRTRDMAHKRAFLVPIVIDGTLEREASVPEKFHEFQWTHLPGGETPPEFIERARRLLSPEPTHVPRATISPAQPISTATLAVGRTFSRPKRALLAIVALVVLGAAAYFAVETFSKHTSSPPASSAQTAFSPPPHSIAVLPFVDMSEKRDQEYFGDGMAEEVTDLLVKLPQITVIGRTSSFQFKGRNEDLRTIGEQLHAAYVVEGSVRRVGPRIRVTAQLIDTRSGTHIWSDSYDRDFGDVLELQEDISAKIGRSLQLAVAADAGQAPRQLGNKDAYALYLRGLYALDRLHPEPLLEAKSDFEQALVLDPSFVRAAEALALTHYWMGEDEDVPPHLAWQRAKAVAQKVLQMDADSTTAHAVLGYVYAYDEFDWRKADAELDRALTLNPRNPVTLSLAAQVSYASGRTEEAVQRINASLAVDPFNPQNHMTLGFILSTSGDLEGAERAFRKSLVFSPGIDGSHYQIAEILLLRGQPQAALEELRTENSADAKDCGLALAYDALGRKADANAALAHLMRVDADLWPFAIAMVYAHRGAANEAFMWAEKAYVQRDSDMLMRIRGHPFFEHLRSDPRYKALMAKINVPE